MKPVWINRGDMEVQAVASDLDFDHVGIIVKDLSAGAGHLIGLLGPLDWTAVFDDAGLGVSVRFARDRAGIVYELITPYGSQSPVARTLKSRTNLLNQIAYRTASLEAATDCLRRSKAVPVGKALPALAFGGARVQFFLSPLGFVVEVIERADFRHRFGHAL